MANSYPINQIDGYKTDHKSQYPNDTEYVFSNLTARSDKHSNLPERPGGVVFFGLQHTVINFLINDWNNNFFNKPKEEVIPRYKRRLSNYLKTDYDTKDIENLHDLGYLPISIRALPEGTIAPIGVPMFLIHNTLKEYAWLTNYLETVLSTETWLGITSATTSNYYRKLFEEYADKTCDNSLHVPYQAHDFSFRGMACKEAAAKSGAAHLLSFVGTDTIPAIDLLEDFYGADSDKEIIGETIFACFPDGAEILTNRGFVPFDDLDEVDLVAQYEESGVVSFVHFDEYHEYDFDGELKSFSGGGNNQIDFQVTPNHRIVYENSQYGLMVKEAKDINSGAGKKFIVSGNKTSGSINKLSDFEKLMIAFQADGSYTTRKNEYTGERTGTIPIRFATLKKERKISRLKEILQNLNFDYSERVYDKGNSYRIQIPFTDKVSKIFDWINLEEVTSGWAREFLEELQYWDGCKVTNRETIQYSSVIKENVDVVQALAALCGAKTHLTTHYDERTNRQPLHSVIILFDTSKFMIGSSNQKVEMKQYTGKVRCVSVPSGMIIVRQNNRVIVTGNSEHSVECTNVFRELSKLKAYGELDGTETLYGLNVKDVFDKMPNEMLAAETFSLKRIISEVYPTGMVSYVADGFDFWGLIDHVLPYLKDDILARDTGSGFDRLVIRPDSGNPKDIICGTQSPIKLSTNDGKYKVESILRDYVQDYVSTDQEHGEIGMCDVTMYIDVDDETYKIYAEPEWNRYDKQYYYLDGFSRFTIEKYDVSEFSSEQKGLIDKLYEIFGGAINTKGYKVLNPLIGAIYGDSITPTLAKEIMEGIELKQFASSNIVLGIGSFTFQMVTRDTYGHAIKATHSIIDGEDYQIFKDPKTDDGTKKSLRGLFEVRQGENGLYVVDGLDSKTYNLETDLMRVMFLNGQLMRSDDLNSIRNRLSSQ